MSYGINQLELVRSAAAAALGLAVPNSLQLLADGVIE
jgi:hypothetical protein